MRADKALVRLGDGRWAVWSDRTEYSLSAIDKMRAIIAERYFEEMAVADVAAAAGLHPTHAMRAFKKATGASIGDAITSFRLAHAQRLLAMTDLILSLVALQSGFGSERRFYEVFRNRTGMTPNQYRTRTRKKSFPKIRP